VVQGDVPDLDGAVLTGGSQRLVIGCEGDPEHTALMSLERGQFLAGHGIPKLDRAVGGPGSQRLIVGGDAYGQHGNRMPMYRTSFLECDEVPKLDLAGMVLAAAGGGER